jgi:N-acetylneuraminic acid mutarotase
VAGNKLYFLGGSAGGANNPVDEVDVYDFTTGQWSTLPEPLPTPRSAPATAVLGNEILVIGGESGSQSEAHDETEALDVTTNTWRSLSLLNEGRHGTQAIVYNDALYIAAGSSGKGGGPELSSQERFEFDSGVAASVLVGPGADQAELAAKQGLTDASTLRLWFQFSRL